MTLAGIPSMRTTYRSRLRVCSARSSAPGGKWHWQGAAPDHFMTHLSMSEGGAEWGEHVGESECRGQA
jgi:hypothetical protein